MTYFGAVRHPMTENHHVIVDGVHASVHILNEQLYRKLSCPLQLAYWANSEWNCSWLVKKLVRLSFRLSYWSTGLGWLCLVYYLLQ